MHWIGQSAGMRYGPNDYQGTSLHRDEGIVYSVIKYPEKDGRKSLHKSKHVVRETQGRIQTEKMGRYERISLKGIIDEDFVNYRVPSMTLMFPKCSFKCGKELCQNSPVVLMPDVRVSVDSLVDRYLGNPISGAVVCQGLEPLDSFEEMVSFLSALRQQGCMDDFVIYTGYNPDEVSDEVYILRQYGNVVIKYGRYLSGQEPHMDEVLGVKLASDNQYAERL